MEMAHTGTHRTPVRQNLSIWPRFPIAIGYPNLETSIASKDEDNIIAALEHPDRVRYLGLELTGPQLEKMVMVMQDPFPVLTSLIIILRNGLTSPAPVLPADFLGGSAPYLQEIHLGAIPFPALPTLLLSASDLVILDIHEIPSNGYFSPQAMITALAVLPRLQDLIIHFNSANTQSYLTHPPPPITRVVLPALIRFDFQGASDYLEVLVAPIDCPQLIEINIDYLNHSVDFPVVQLSKLFDRFAGPETIPFALAEVFFDLSKVVFDMYRHGNTRRRYSRLSCEGVVWQVTQMAQVFSQFSTILSTIVYLKLDVPVAEHRHFEATGAEWLHFLNQFSTVQALYISWRFAPHVALALENITGEMVAEAWSSLDLICLEDQPTSSIEKFIVARQLSGRPVTVVLTETEFDQRVLSQKISGQLRTL